MTQNPLDQAPSAVEDSTMVSKAVSAYLSRIGKLASGVPKNFTPEDLVRRRKLAGNLRKPKKKASRPR